MAGFGLERLTLGGMSPVSKMPQTLQRDARNAVISRWLGKKRYAATHNSGGKKGLPNVAFDTTDEKLVISAEVATDPVRFRRVSLSGT